MMSIAVKLNEMSGICDKTQKPTRSFKTKDKNCIYTKTDSIYYVYKNCLVFCSPRNNINFCETIVKTIHKCFWIIESIKIL